MVTDLFEHVAEAFVSFNEEGEIVGWNRRASELLGWEREEVLGKQMITLLFPKDQRMSRYSSINSYLATEREEDLGPERENTRVLHRDGRELQVKLSLRASHDPDEGLVFNCFLTDTTEEQRAREEERHARQLLDSSADSVITVAADGSVIAANQAAREWYGWSEEEFLGMNLAQLIPSHLAGEAEALLAAALEGESVEGKDSERVTSGGEVRPITLTAVPVLGPGLVPSGATLIESDLSEAQRYAEQLEYLADHDPLTGLHNRRRFAEEMEERLAAKRGGAIILIDIDHFKLVNDAHGHEMGDKALSRLAGTLGELASAVGEVELAHFGRDEFAVLLPESQPTPPRELASEWAKRLSRELSSLTGRTVTLSAGVVAWESESGEHSPEGAQPHSRSSDELLISADLALYSAKERGGGRTILYEEGLMSGIQQAQRLQRAMEEDRLVLYAQPILNISSGEVDQYELLLRVRDGDELLSPGGFLAAAERLGLIGAVDRWVLRQGIELAGSGVRVEINLSGRSMTDPEIPELIAAHMKEFDADPADVIFEITETAAIASMNEATEFAGRLTQLGCQFALDDFGTGFGSFTYLKHLPVSVLKIDGEFIRDLVSDPVDQKIVRAIVSVAHAMGHKTVAEWVADGDCLREVEQLGVDYAQGYEVGRPMPIADIELTSKELATA